MLPRRVQWDHHWYCQPVRPIGARLLLLLLPLLGVVLASYCLGPPAYSKVGRWLQGQQLMKAPRGLPRGLLEESSFTLVTLSHSPRLRSLQTWVAHYGSCPGVQAIIIVWDESPLDENQDLPRVPVPLKVRREASDSLNNRFQPDADIRTRAVLMLDDDVMIRCEVVSQAFAAWRQQQHKLVGFFPRRAVVDSQKPSYNLVDDYTRGAYNLILTKGTFMDSRAFQMYASPPYAKARHLVDALQNCEDILMNFVWAKEMRAELGAAANSTVLFASPQCYAETSKLCRAPGAEWSISMGSRSKTHLRNRALCGQLFAEMLGSNPLPHVPFEKSTVRPREIWPEKADGWVAQGYNSSLAQLFRSQC